MQFNQLIENTRAWKNIEQDFSKGNSVHAYLVQCNDIALQREIGLKMAMQVLCKEVPACEKCRTCHNIEMFTHPDVFWVPATNKKITVEDLAIMMDSMYLCGMESEKKVYIIPSAQDMTPIHQNKLLKVLEEPPSGVTFVLLTKSEANILMTVRSRTRFVAFSRLTDEKMKDYLKEKYPEHTGIDDVISCSGGKISRAIAWIEQENFSNLYQDIFRVFSNFTNSGQILQVNTVLSQYTSDMQLLLEFCTMIFRDVMCVRVAPHLIKAKHKIQELTAIAQLYPEPAIVSVLDVLEHARERLFFNSNATMLLDWLLFQILEGRHKCRRS